MTGSRRTRRQLLRARRLGVGDVPGERPAEGEHRDADESSPGPAVATASRWISGHVRASTRRPGPLMQRTKGGGRLASTCRIRRDWSAARAKLAAERVCRVCAGEPVQAAYVIGCRHDRAGGLARLSARVPRACARWLVRGRCPRSRGVASDRRDDAALSQLPWHRARLRLPLPDRARRAVSPTTSSRPTPRSACPARSCSR